MNASRRLAPFLKPYRLWAVLAPLMMALEVVLDLLQPRLLQQSIDRGILRHDLALVTRTGAWMMTFSLIGTVGGVLGGTVRSLAAHGREATSDLNFLCFPI